MEFIVIDPVNTSIDAFSISQEQRRSRQRAESNKNAQMLRDHINRSVSLKKSQDQAQLELDKSYDRMGQRIALEKKQGQNINIEV